MKSVKEKSCGVILYTSKKGIQYLLLHYKGGHWDFPKGHQEKGESDEETALREVREETGIEDVIIHGGLFAKYGYDFMEENKKISKSVYFFIGETPEAVPVHVDSKEHQGYRWLPYKKAYDQLTHDNPKNMLERAHKRILGWKKEST